MVDDQKQLIEEHRLELAEYRKQLAAQQTQAVAKEQVYKVRLSMIECQNESNI